MAVKSNFASGDVLTASDVNSYLTNGGLVYITETLVTAGSSATVSFNNCFSATYDNYRIVIDDFQPSTNSRALNFRMRVGGVDATGADYAGTYTGTYLDGTSTASTYGSQTSGQTATFNSDSTIPVASSVFDVIAPFRAQRTYVVGNAILFNAQFGLRTFFGVHGLSTSYDGITLLLNSTGNITKIRVRIYGYRQA